MEKDEYYKCSKCESGIVYCNIKAAQHGMPPKYSYTCDFCGASCYKLCYEDFLGTEYQQVLIVEETYDKL